MGITEKGAVGCAFGGGVHWCSPSLFWCVQKPDKMTNLFIALIEITQADTIPPTEP